MTFLQVGWLALQLAFSLGNCLPDWIPICNPQAQPAHVIKLNELERSFNLVSHQDVGDSPYDSNTHCLVTLKAPVGHSMLAYFSYADLEEAFDWVKLRDGGATGTEITTVTGNIGRHMSPKHRSSSSEMTIEFQTDSSMAYGGFIMYFKVFVAAAVMPAWMEAIGDYETTWLVNVTGGATRLVSHGSFGTGHRLEYWSKRSLTLRAPDGYAIRVKFVYLHLDYNDGHNDYLNLYDAILNKRLAAFGGQFGNVSSREIQSKSNAMRLEFRSSSSYYNNYNGFSLLCWSIGVGVCAGDISIDPVSDSGFTLNDQYFMLSHSTAGNGTYPNGSQCTATVRVPRGYQITARFEYIDLEPGHDRVTLYDGELGSGNRVTLADISERNYLSREEFRLQSGAMTVQFQTDESIAYLGFRLVYTIGLSSPSWCNCGLDVSTQMPGDITDGAELTCSNFETQICDGSLNVNLSIRPAAMLSRYQFWHFPSGYNEAKECMATVRAPAGYVIHTRWTTWRTDGTGSRLIIYDGPSPSARIMAYFPDNWGQFNELLSTGNSITLRYQPAVTGSMDTFQLFYKATLQNAPSPPIVCAGGFNLTALPFVGRESLMSHARFDGIDAYSSPTGCSWVLRAPHGAVVSARVAFFESRAGTQLTMTGADAQQMLALTHQDSRVHNGALIPDTRYYSAAMTVAYSDMYWKSNENPRAGFLILYTAVPSGSVCTSGIKQVTVDPYSGVDAGSLISHLGVGDGSIYGGNANCSWRLQAPANHFISVTVAYLDIETGYDWLSVTDTSSGTVMASLSMDVWQFRQAASSSGGISSGIANLLQYNSTGSQVIVRFATDSAIERTGFYLRYGAFDGRG